MTANPLKKTILVCFPIICSIAFGLFFTNEFGNMVAFTTLMVSLWFIMVSIWMLVWILKKDCGTEKMIEISETIKEGSQGYFKTQYTSIFKLALLFGAGIFLMYLFRAPTKNSTL